MNNKHIFSLLEPMRVNKWLAQIGVCSRREAEGLIAQGHIQIDGEIVKDVGRKIEKGQVLEVLKAGKSHLSSQFSLIYHKPIGIVSGQPEKGEIPAIRMIKSQNQIGEGACPPDNASIPPIGRLDKDSRGLLLMSQDGVLAKSVIAPDSGIEKEYIVKVTGYINAVKLTLLRHGLELDGRKLKPAIVEDLGQNSLRFILKEGRNRQIRRMCEEVELKVIDLLRIRIGTIELGNMPEGKWRNLEAQEIAKFKNS